MLFGHKNVDDAVKKKKKHKEVIMIAKLFTCKNLIKQLSNLS